MNRGHWLILAFNALYLLIFAIYYISIQNYEFLVYILVIVILGLILGINLRKSHFDVKVFELNRNTLNIQKSKKKNQGLFDNLVLWLLSIWGLLHMIGGGVKIAGTKVYALRLIDIVNNGGDFYILKMDQLIHFYGFFVAAILVYQLLMATGSNASKSPKLMVFLAWIGSMGLGALNEVVEFIAFISLAQTGVGDMYNTGLDLIFNLAGALVGAFVAHKIYKN